MSIGERSSPAAARDALAPVEGSVEVTDVDVADGVSRRRVLTWLAAAPTITMVAHVGLDAASPALAGAATGTIDAAAAQLPGGLDLGDALTLAGTPTALAMVVRITAANRVEVELTRVEMGQGITTTIAMLVADELGARLADVDVLLADAAQDQIAQMTALSNTTRAMFGPTRTVAAGIRARLITAAAARWRVLPSSVSTSDTMLRGPGGRSATFADLAADAATVAVPLVSTSPKPTSQFTVVGQPAGRIDARAIVTGKAQYSLDQGPPDALPTVVARPPTLGGTVASVDDSSARTMPGVVAITRIPTGVAVTATTFGEAMAAKDQLRVTWNNGPLVGKSDADVFNQLRSAIGSFPPKPLFSKTVEATFEFLAVSHAPMEVHGAVADVAGGTAEVWCASQVAPYAQRVVAQAIGLPTGSVTLHLSRAGGAFGRRLFAEPAVEAAQVSKAIGKPVRLMWTRNDDMRHGRFRLPSITKVRASHLGGVVLAFDHRLASLQLDMSHGLGDALTAGGITLLQGGVDQTFFQFTQKVPYSFGSTSQALAEVNLPIPSATWRSVYSAFTAVSNEIVVDDLARALGRDPVELRRARLTSDRLRNVLNLVASKGSWGRPMPTGQAQGVGVWEEYKSAVAYLVELDVTGPVPRPLRVVVAADVGLCVNPKGLEAQLQGVTIDAASTVFRAGNHLVNGAMKEGSFADFHWARMRDAPITTEVTIVSSSDQPGGAGELGYPAACAAMANAYARATGTSPRRFPIFDS